MALFQFLWMQMVLEIESERYRENVESSSNWSHLHFLAVSVWQLHLLLYTFKELQPMHMQLKHGSEFPYSKGSRDRVDFFVSFETNNK